MTLTSRPPGRQAPRKGWRSFLAVLVLAAAAIGWVAHGPHRRLPNLLVGEAAHHGLILERGAWNAGWLSTTLREARFSLGGAPGVTLEIDRARLEHWPLRPPRLSFEGIRLVLSGDPVLALQALSQVWYTPAAKLETLPFDLTFHHRLLGSLHLAGITLERRNDRFELAAAQVRLGDLLWQDVHAVIESSKGTLTLALAPETGRPSPRLAIFPSADGTARWLLDLPHGPARIWLERLGLALSDDFAKTRMAGSISLDIPDDPKQAVRGRVQMVVDDWPLFAPPDAEPLLGRTFSLLSNLVASDDGARWELPRVELTMPVFSLVGQGSLRLGHDKRLVLAVQGERTCPQLGALLPPSPPAETVRRFTRQRRSVAPGGRAPGVGLAIRWDSASAGEPLRPVARLIPGCGIPAWPEDP